MSSLNFFKFHSISLMYGFVTPKEYLKSEIYSKKKNLDR